MTTVPPRVYPSRAKPKVDKNCALCGAHFRSGSDRSIHCSRGCTERASELKRQAKRREAVGLDKPYACRECATDFMRDTRQKVYCSTKCKDAYNGRRRVRVKRVSRGMTATAICSICKAEHNPRLYNQETCGSRDCINKSQVLRRMKPCLGCGEIGQHSGRTKFPGYCRTCKPVSRTSAVSIAISNQDYPAIHTALRERSEVDIKTGCWVWTKSKTKGGYGCVGGVEVLPDGSVKNKQYMAHRLSLEVKMGRPLGAHQAHHICANRACCNPDHLQPVTNAENVGEMRARKSFEARIAELETALAKYEPNHPLIWAA